LPGPESPDGPRLEAKVVAALERIGRALRVQLWNAVKRRGLSPVQAQILLHLRAHDETLGRVGSIAREFGLTPPTVSDSVSALEAKGLVERSASAADGRAAVLTLTPAGHAAARELQSWAAGLEEAIAAMPPADQEAALQFLLRLIEQLQRRGSITVARVCFTCRFFRPAAEQTAGEPYCALLEKPLPPAALRVDCPEHEPASA